MNSIPYLAPLKDMSFAMRELGGLDRIIERHEELADGVVEVVLQEASRFAAGVLAPTNHAGDVQGCRWDAGVVHVPDSFRQAHRAMCDAGWFGMPAPTDHGGQGMPTLVSTAVLEMCKSANLALSLCQMLTLGAIQTIVRHGSEALRRRYVAPMVEGRWTGTMNLTEPQAGSDLAAIATRAAPEGEHYRITGTKIFITWGEHDMADNIVHLVLARLPDAPRGVKGISLFVCPKYLVGDDGTLGARNEVACTSIEHKLGIHASPTATMVFGGDKGAMGWLLGKPHEGVACMFTMMNHARLNVGLEGVAIAERAYQQARAYALERVQGCTLGRDDGVASRAIVGHPDVRRMLMDMKARTAAARALAYYTAGLMDTGHDGADAKASRRVDLLIPVVKGWCTDSAQAVAYDALQVHGGMGFVEETGVAQHVRDARITTIYEGTTGIQANDLIRRKLRADRGTAMRVLLDDMQADARAWTRHGDDVIERIGTALLEACAQLQAATQHLLDCGERQAAASAVRMLQLTGTVVAGWLLGREAEAATAQLAGGGDDVAFLHSRRHTALHYAAHMLAQAHAYRRMVTDGADTVLLLDDAQF